MLSWKDGKNLIFMCNCYSFIHHSFSNLFLSFFFRGTHGDPHASDEEKNRVFLKFLEEGNSMFKKYQVLYLKGISVPMKYEDLLKPEKESNYGCVNWANDPPSTNNFSLVSYQLTKEEDEEHSHDVRSSLTNAVVGWMAM